MVGREQILEKHLGARNRNSVASTKGGLFLSHNKKSGGRWCWWCSGCLTISGPTSLLFSWPFPHGHRKTGVGGANTFTLQTGKGARTAPASSFPSIRKATFSQKFLQASVYSSQICYLVTSSAGKLEKYLASLDFINKVGKRNEAGNGCWVSQYIEADTKKNKDLPGYLGQMVSLRDLISRTTVHPFKTD